MWDKRIKILAASILIMLSAIGQTHFTKRFSSNNGLLSSDNYMTLQDKDGYLWIGSHNGISKFDGNRFKHYTTEHGLPKNDIWYMRQDNIGRMWIGGYYDGVYYIKDNKMESLPNAPETKALMYSAMVKDTIYFTSMGYESYAYFDGTFHMNMTKDSSHFIHVSDDVSFYIGYKSNDNRVGVKLRNSNEITWRYNIYRKDFFLSGHRQFIKTKRDSILLIGKNGLKMVNPQDEYGVPVSKFESLNPSGEVFVRTGDVNRVYENFEFKRRDPHLEKMLSMTNLTETAWLLKDNEGNLWSTLYRGELVMVPRQSLYVKRYTNIENDNNFRNPTIWNGKVFTNSLLGNLYVLDPWSDEFMRKDKKALEYNMEKEKITSLASSNNSIVAKRSTILDVFDSTGYSSYRFSEKQGLSDSISPPPLTHGGLLVSSDTFLSCGFNKYRLTGNKAVLVEQSGLEISKLSVILNTQYYYISGGIAGLFLYSKRGKTYKKLASYQVQCALRVGDSILVGTNGKGLIILNSLGEVLSTSLTGYSINGIAKSKTEYFIASNKGVLRAKDNEETKSVEITGYINRADGLLSDEVNGVVQDSNKLYITSVDGLYSVDLLGLDALQELKPHLRIEEVLLDDSTQVESTVFGYNENNLTFKYNSISFFVFLLVQN